MRLCAYVQGFSSGVDWWGDNLGKMTKNCMKIIKLAFLGQNSGGACGEGLIFQVVGGILPVPNPN